MGKTVLITGAARGIGRAAAIQFAAAGYNVAVNFFHSNHEAKNLVEALSQNSAGKIMAFRADVSDQVQIEKMVRDIGRRIGEIDVLINNAGIAQQKLFTEITTSEWMRMFSVNTDGVFYACRTVLPQMLARHSGKIINVSSIWGMVGASCEVHYSAAKAAVIGLSKALAKEVAPSGVQVNCVCPGVVNTDMLSGLDAQTLDQLAQDTPIGRLGTPEDIAALLLFLASEQATFITGQVISPNGGFLIT